MKKEYEKMVLLDKALESLMIHHTFLVAPLNWGLGHAARCIPIIKKLIASNKNVILASDGNALQLLTTSFPGLPFYELPSYGITYPYNSISLNLLINSVNIYSAIKAEHKSLQDLLRQEKIDIILSDNRYGIYNHECTSIFISHQLQIIHPNSLLRQIGNRINKMLLAKFTMCWIPDFPPPNSIIPALTTSQKSIPHLYVGMLSRMTLIEAKLIRKYLVILSGPEPKRSELEILLLDQLAGKSYLLVRGKPGQDTANDSNDLVVDFMSHQLLSQEISQSEYIVCRSGYTSIMDLLKLNKKAILIPTPGQTEQEYLAKMVTSQYPDQFITLSQKQLTQYNW